MGINPLGAVQGFVELDAAGTELDETIRMTRHTTTERRRLSAYAQPLACAQHSCESKGR